ncbi:MAG: alpha/beta hydrolase [Betaproteobacteria bacterium]|nr:alpha/beta hydrolase [Pseudomonadota bacterium]NBO11606.1 alpha/beta hydrolase [Betaproteobacteria bacterium]NBO43217.1 alpha/beta hydrolase [Betaproteobacteria bacterium]NBP09371.1 alpha/beta hydrolase [Betaproteobacteria bacterium]NBP61611.1 alpha/beta hydrolase [Betaproteobacteria bacterium]
MLDPQARALLDLMEKNGIPQVWQQTPTEARQSYRERRFFSQEEPASDVQAMSLSAPGPLGPIPLRAFRPSLAPKDAALAVLVYFHGGGWVIGDLDTHDVLCRQLAREAQAVVVSVDYRMGPEYEFPAAVEDCWAATCWIAEHGSSLGMDSSRLAVGGDSAGGNLAAVISLMAREQAPHPKLAFQLLIYPATEMDAGTESMRANGEGYLLTSRSMQWFVKQYFGDRANSADIKTWRASPLLAASHAGLPPALVLTAGFDPLRDEGRMYADKLSAAGTPAQYVCFERQIHGFVTMSRVIDEAKTAVSLCAKALARAFDAVGVQEA